VVTNSPPQLSGSVTTITYTENGPPLPIQPTAQIVDPDNVILESASVSILSNFRSGEDQLIFTPVSGITGLYNTSTGVLSFNGNASLGSYQSILQAVSYVNSSENPDPSARLLEYSVFDGLDFSNLLDRGITIVPVDDPPVLAGSPDQIQYTTGNLVIDNSIGVSDVDNTQITGGDNFHQQ